MPNLITSYTPGADTVDNGLVGFRFVPTIGQGDLFVVSLGIRKATGNTGIHTIFVLDASGNALTSVGIDLTTGAVGTFFYADLVSPGPAGLIAGTTYYLMAQVTSAQVFSDSGATTSLVAGSIAAASTAALGIVPTIGTANEQFVGLDLTFGIAASKTIGYSATFPQLQTSKLVGYSATFPQLQVSKLVGYSATFPQLQVSKLVGYVALVAPKNIEVSKLIAYAALFPVPIQTMIRVSKLVAYAALFPVVVPPPPPPPPFLPARDLIVSISPTSGAYVTTITNRSFHVSREPRPTATDLFNLGGILAFQAAINVANAPAPVATMTFTAPDGSVLVATSPRVYVGRRPLRTRIGRLRPSTYLVYVFAPNVLIKGLWRFTVRFQPYPGANVLHDFGHFHIPPHTPMVQ